MYICCRLELDPLQPATDIFIAALGELGFESFEETETGLNAYIRESDWDEPALRAIPYWEAPGWEADYTVEHIPLKNWNAVWEADYQPIEVGLQCRVRAPFHPPADPPVEYDLVIAPKMSFGTGHHQTTWLMLNHLLGMEVQGRSVLDMGAGTGVLAILAARKGAHPVLAVDIDGWSAENCRENATRNGVPEIEAVLGDKTALAGRTFDVILANINKNILLADLPEYEKCLRPGGDLIMSGFYKLDLQDIRHAAQSLGLRFETSNKRDNWMVASFVKPE